MLDVFRRMTILRTEEMAVHPKITGLFLGERVREVRGTHRAHQRHGEWPVRMITLSAAAIEREGIAAVCRTELAEPCGNFRDRRVPGDRFEAAIGTPAKRRR